jgi:hypothetical protein
MMTQSLLSSYVQHIFDLYLIRRLLMKWLYAMHGHSTSMSFMKSNHFTGTGGTASPSTSVDPATQHLMQATSAQRR